MKKYSDFQLFTQLSRIQNYFGKSRVKTDSLHFRCTLNFFKKTDNCSWCLKKLLDREFDLKDWPVKHIVLNCPNTILSISKPLTNCKLRHFSVLKIVYALGRQTLVTLINTTCRSSNSKLAGRLFFNTSISADKLVRKCIPCVPQMTPLSELYSERHSDLSLDNFSLCEFI
ncbi:hypothetical protein AGLY_011199 [Aphis glycines]|uniref:Uncharacterized protein n=1 Tax=Aphis glycines TaxID=307491 RepID=A0A6G0TF00_APHGL|nr:hypothetical protein AGLY_011199 [Aphis glycines]